MPHDKNIEELFMVLNEVCTCLSEGESWHKKSANECRRLAVRGWGKWHDEETLGDKKIHDKFDKILMDKLVFTPTINNQKIERANKYTIPNMDEFKRHHIDWINREEDLIEVLNISIQLSRSIDMEIYQKLCDITNEVQNEVMRVKMTIARLELAGWNGHDIGVCSKWIHDYFEKEHKDGEPINFNIG